LYGRSAGQSHLPEVELYTKSLRQLEQSRVILFQAVGASQLIQFPKASLLALTGH